VNVGVVIQPSELLKIATPLMLAWWFQRARASCRAMDFVIAFVLLGARGPDHEAARPGHLAAGDGRRPVGDLFAGLPWKLIVPPVLLGVVGIALIVWFEPRCAPMA
jgi:rod shape determining protein RodA